MTLQALAADATQAVQLLYLALLLRHTGLQWEAVTTCDARSGAPGHGFFSAHRLTTLSSLMFSGRASYVACLGELQRSWLCSCVHCSAVGHMQMVGLGLHPDYLSEWLGPQPI